LANMRAFEGGWGSVRYNLSSTREGKAEFLI
jgi:hypothetical protein